MHSDGFRTMAIGYHTSDVFWDHPTAGFIRCEICFQHSTGGIVLPIYEQKTAFTNQNCKKEKRIYIYIYIYIIYIYIYIYTYIYIYIVCNPKRDRNVKSCQNEGKHHLYEFFGCYYNL